MHASSRARRAFEFIESSGQLLKLPQFGIESQTQTSIDSQHPRKTAVATQRLLSLPQPSLPLPLPELGSGEGHAQTAIAMEDARSNRVPSPPNDQMPPTIAASFDQDVSNHTQSLLQRMAQDASSQAQNTAALLGRPSDEESASNAIRDQALVNGHVLPLSTGGADQSANGNDTDNLNQSTLLSGGIEAQDSHLRYHDFDDLALQDSSIGLTQANIESLGDHPSLDAAISLADVESEPPRVSAFAKLEFDDGEFYMNTYSVELGRDVRAARQASENHTQALRRASGSSRKPSSSSGEASRASSKKVKREDGHRMASSMVSDSGGVMAVDRSDSETARHRRGKKSKSATSSSQQLSRKSSMNYPTLQTDYQSLALASLSDPLPSPESCPLVPIHPPTLTDGISISHKSISRKHVKIAFNFEKHLFELNVMGRNGAFIDEEWYPAGDTQPLRSGSLIQIGGVGIRFLLPDVALGETGAKNNLVSDPASFELENENGTYDNEEDSSGAESGEPDEDEEESGDDNDDDGSNESDEANRSESISEEETRGRPREPKPTLANRPVRNRKPARAKEPSKTKALSKARRPEKVKLKLKARKEPTPEPAAPPPKRKGPGRPPKNGIISKRAQAELAKQAREAAKSSEQGEADANPGRSKGKSIPISTGAKQVESNLQPNGKRKYKKRKSKIAPEGGEPQAVRESTEHTESVPPEQNAAPAPPPKPPKPVKPPKPPRSPSPVFDEATLTPEQLAKPSSSYVILIQEALTNSATGQMSLPQIYRAIERKYPFYKLRVQTTGWQSSVRHNLSQHPAFCKIERDGKGWMWGLVPGVSIEKEKKRRFTPPPMAASGHYPASQMMHPPYPFSVPYPPYATHPVMSIGQRPPYAPPPHFAAPSTASSLPPALANAVDTSSSYQSPYATGPSIQISEMSQASQQTPVADGQQPVRSKPQDISTVNGNPPQSINPYPQNPIRTSTPLTAPSPYGPTPPPLSGLELLLSQQPPEVTPIIQKFKKHLLGSMSDNPLAESIIDSAIHRVLQPNVSPQRDRADGERGLEDDRQEQAITGILQGVMDNLRRKHGEGGGTSAVANGAGTGEGGQGGGERVGHRDPSLIQLLENDGTLRLSSPQPASKEQQQPPPQERREEGDSQSRQDDASKTVNLTTKNGVEDPDVVGVEGMDAARSNAENGRPSRSPVMDHTSGRGTKRLLSDADEAERAMDAQPREAKRVAT
ncbi:MAG: hypothetical protein LQ339_008061 [Xanthoria mediterranea]|nr:MAG: hypothetical protein LQ339_008061 [Xanthoria mediterranea]